MSNKSYPAFSVYGIEIEYMIVDAVTLDILPIADKLIEKMAGRVTNEFEHDQLAVSNELALHVIEFKTNGPKSAIHSVNRDFYQLAREVNLALKEFNAILMPSGMHPWYVPTDDFKLWPHGDKKIYQAYHRIFNCRGHGWANLQSIHLNLPFGNEREFVDLHSAIRLILPIIPALTASTPFFEGKTSGYLDTRLLYYGKNQKTIPSIAGKIVPEFVKSIDEYHQKILQPMFRDIAPHDTDETLQEEWLNSRGAIARFDRDAIEVRVIDSQECVQADLACTALISLVLKDVMAHSNKYYDTPISEDILKAQYDVCIKEGMSARIVDTVLLKQLQLDEGAQTVQAVWQALYERVLTELHPDFQSQIANILSHGNLASRLLAAVDNEPNTEKLLSVYRDINQCLQENRQFNV